MENQQTHPAVASGACRPLAGRQYYAHEGTANASFLRVSAELAAEGVRSRSFMLALYDPDLHGVDPRDPALGDELKSKVLAEIVQNPWYFFREVVRIPVPGGVSAFELHQGNAFLLWCLVANLNVFLILPRQTYKTVSTCCFYLWAYGFGATNSHVLFFNKEHIDSKNNLKRLKDVAAELPAWLRVDVLGVGRDGTDAIEAISSDRRGNKIDAKPVGTDPSGADKLGRGATVPLKWYDEIAFMKYARETFLAAAPAGAQAMALAARNGSPYGTCVTTTPNNLDRPEAEFTYKIKMDALQWRNGLYDLGPARVRRMVDEEAEVPFVFAQFTWRQIGRTERWYRDQRRELLNDTAKIKRELDLVWPLSGEGSVFEEDQLDALREVAAPVVAVLPVSPPGGDAPPGLCIEWIEQPDVRKAYVVGVDTASGEGTGDFTAFVFHDPEDMRAVGVMKTRTANSEALRSVFEHVFVGLFPRSVAVVERNHLGLSMINFMLRKLDLASRLFYVDKVKVAERTLGHGSGRSLATKRKVRDYGVTTDAGTREAMVRHLFDIVDRAPHLLRLQALQDDIRTLARKKSGKIEHRPGFHDDALFAFLVAQWADRADGGVLRMLVAAQSGQGRSEAALPLVKMNARAAALEPRPEEERAGPPGRPAPESERSWTVSTDDYVRMEEERKKAEDPAARRRREMSALIVGLNSPGGTPAP